MNQIKGNNNGNLGAKLLIFVNVVVFFCLVAVGYTYFKSLQVKAAEIPDGYDYVVQVEHGSRATPIKLIGTKNDSMGYFNIEAVNGMLRDSTSFQDVVGNKDGCKEQVKGIDWDYWERMCSLINN